MRPANELLEVTSVTAGPNEAGCLYAVADGAVHAVPPTVVNKLTDQQVTSARWYLTRHTAERAASGGVRLKPRRLEPAAIEAMCELAKAVKS